MPWPSGIKYFRPTERGFDSPDAPGSAAKHMRAELLFRLDRLREKCGFALYVNSGYRTKKYNLWLRIKRGLKSVDSSAHCRGYAVDVRVHSSRERFFIRNAAKAVGFRRIGQYKNHMHIDCDPEKPQDVEWRG